MHTSFFRFGGISSDLPDGILKDIHNFVDNFLLRLIETQSLLNTSRI